MYRLEKVGLLALRAGGHGFLPGPGVVQEREPTVSIRAVAVDDPEETPLDGLGDRSSAAVSDLDLVHRTALTCQQTSAMRTLAHEQVCLRE